MSLAVCHGHMTNITKTINKSIPNEKVNVCVLFLPAQNSWLMVKGNCQDRI